MGKIKINQNSIRRILLYILVLYFLYPFHMENNIGKVINLIYWCLPIFFLGYKYKFLFRTINRIKNNSIFVISLVILFVSLVYACVLSFSSGDFSFVSECYIKPIWKFVRFIFIYLLVVDVYGEKNSFHNFIAVVTKVTAIYVLVTLYMMANTSFMHYWLSLVQPDVKIMYAWQDFNRVGLMGRTNADTSMLISLFFVGACYDKKINKSKDLIYSISMFFLLVGNFLYGRLGLFFSILSIILFYDLKHVKKLTTDKFCKIILGAGILIVAFFIYGYTVDNDIFQHAVNLAIEPVKALFSSQSNGFSLGHSGDELKEMYFWMGMDTFLLGDGFYQTAAGARYMQTDPAIMRKILFGGIIQIVLMYLSASTLLVSFYRKFRKINRRFLRYTAIMLAVIFILGEMKDTVYSNWFVTCIIFIISFSNDYQHCKQNKIQNNIML